MPDEVQGVSRNQGSSRKGALVKFKILVQRTLAYCLDVWIITLLEVLVLSVVRAVVPGFKFHSIAPISLSSGAEYILAMWFKVGVLETMCLALLYVMFTVSILGGTLGMRVFDLKIVKFGSGSATGARQIALRHILSYLSLLLFCLGYLWAIVDSRGRTWHDIVSGTLVTDGK